MSYGPLDWAHCPQTGAPDHRLLQSVCHHLPGPQRDSPACLLPPLPLPHQDPPLPFPETNLTLPWTYGHPRAPLRGLLSPCSGPRLYPLSPSTGASPPAYPRPLQGTSEFTKALYLFSSSSLPPWGS